MYWSFVPFKHIMYWSFVPFWRGGGPEILFWDRLSTMSYMRGVKSGTTKWTFLEENTIYRISMTPWVTTNTCSQTYSQSWRLYEDLFFQSSLLQLAWIAGGCTTLLDHLHEKKVHQGILWGPLVTDHHL